MARHSVDQESASPTPEQKKRLAVLKEFWNAQMAEEQAAPDQYFQTYDRKIRAEEAAYGLTNTEASDLRRTFKKRPAQRSRLAK